MVHVCATLAGAAIIAQPNFVQETVGLMAYVKMMQDVSVKMALAARDVKWLQAALMGVATMAFAFLSQVPRRAASVNAEGLCRLGMRNGNMPRREIRQDVQWPWQVQQ